MARYWPLDEFERAQREWMHLSTPTNGLSNHEARKHEFLVVGRVHGQRRVRACRPGLPRCLRLDARRSPQRGEERYGFARSTTWRWHQRDLAARADHIGAPGCAPNVHEDRVAAAHPLLVEASVVDTDMDAIRRDVEKRASSATHPRRWVRIPGFVRSANWSVRPLGKVSNVITTAGSTCRLAYVREGQ